MARRSPRLLIAAQADHFAKATEDEETSAPKALQVERRQGRAGAQLKEAAAASRGGLRRESPGEDGEICSAALDVFITCLLLV